MSLLKQQQDYQDNALTETPFQRGRREWDERIGGSVLQAKSWRMMTLLVILILGASVFMNMYQLKGRTVESHYIELDCKGNVNYAGPARQGNFRQSEAIVSKQLRDVIRWLRSLPTDIVVARENMNKAYHFFTPAVATRMNAENAGKNPLEEFGNRTRQVEFTRVLPVGETSMQMHWNEKTYDSNGKLLDTRSYTGLFTYLFQDPKTKYEVANNPLGFWISEYQWKEDL